MSTRIGRIRLTRFRPIAAGGAADRPGLTGSRGRVRGRPRSRHLVVACLTIWPLVTAVHLVIQLAYCFGSNTRRCWTSASCRRAFIRAIAGGVAAGIPLSQWFLLVMAFWSLFMVAGSATRNPARRAHGHQDQEVAGELHEHLPAVCLDAFGDGRGAVLRAMGLRTRRRQRFLVSSSRWCRSPSPSCVTPSTSTAVWLASLRKIALRDRVLQMLALAWIGTVIAAVVLG